MPLLFDGIPLDVQAAYNKLGVAQARAISAGVGSKATLGYIFGGVKTVKVKNFPASYYVTLPQGNFTTALHKHRISPTFGVPIELGIEGGKLCILGEEQEQAQGILSLYGVGVGVGEHTQSITTIDEVDPTLTPTEGGILYFTSGKYRNFSLGSLLPAPGLTVAVHMQIPATTTDALWVGPLHVTGSLEVSGVLRII